MVEEKRNQGVSRRAFCIGAGSVAVLMGVGALRYVGHTPITRPPGGQDESHLVSGCIRCERCYEACPRHVIAPAHIENGILGMRSPMVDFDSGAYCDFCFEENDGHPLCLEVCPTNALEILGNFTVGDPIEHTRGDIILGLAELDESTCLAYRLTGCRACYDACKYGAIELENENSANPLPHVIADRCNGCGACQAVCLSISSGSMKSTERAIVVKPIDTEN